MTTEQQLLASRGKLFSKYVGAELKGAIRSHGHTQGEVADAIGRPRPTMTNWLNAKPAIPISEALQVCNYIEVDLQTIVSLANERVIAELGPWPPITIDIDNLNETKQAALADDDARMARTLAKIEDPELRMALAAYRDPDKGKEDPFDNGAD